MGFGSLLSKRSALLTTPSIQAGANLHQYYISQAVSTACPSSTPAYLTVLLHSGMEVSATIETRREVGTQSPPPALIEPFWTPQSLRLPARATSTSGSRAISGSSHTPHPSSSSASGQQVRDGLPFLGPLFGGHHVYKAHHETRDPKRLDPIYSNL